VIVGKLAAGPTVMMFVPVATSLVAPGGVGAGPALVPCVAPEPLLRLAMRVVADWTVTEFTVTPSPDTDRVVPAPQFVLPPVMATFTVEPANSSSGLAWTTRGTTAPRAALVRMASSDVRSPNLASGW